MNLFNRLGLFLKHSFHWNEAPIQLIRSESQGYRLFLNQRCVTAHPFNTLLIHSNNTWGLTESFCVYLNQSAFTLFHQSFMLCDPSVCFRIRNRQLKDPAYCCPPYGTGYNTLKLIGTEGLLDSPVEFDRAFEKGTSFIHLITGAPHSERSDASHFSTLQQLTAAILKHQKPISVCLIYTYPGYPHDSENQTQLTALIQALRATNGLLILQTRGFMSGSPILESLFDFIIVSAWQCNATLWGSLAKKIAPLTQYGRSHYRITGAIASSVQALPPLIFNMVKAQRFFLKKQEEEQTTRIELANRTASQVEQDALDLFLPPAPEFIKKTKSL